MTHGDRIRQMPDEELAKFISALSCARNFGIDCCDAGEWPYCKSVKGNYCYGLTRDDNPVVANDLKFLKTEVED